jgi:Xaa-Pro aminopeptidase
MTDIFARRLRRITGILQAWPHPAAVVVSSAPSVVRSRDGHYPYRQNSDFYYLTGSNEPDLTVFLRSARKRPLVVAPKPDPIKVVWEGRPREDGRALARRLGADLIETSDPMKEILALLPGVSEVLHQNSLGTTSGALARKLADTPSHLRGSLPVRLAHIDAILENLRLFKEPCEIAAIQRSAAITNRALHETVPFMHPGQTERTIAATIEYWFRLQGASPAFNTIAATGPSAATLHYHHLDRPLKRNDLLLIDCGAEHQMYCADITRCVPVGGVFEGIRREIYTIVLAAQEAALKAVRPNVAIQKVYDAAARELIDGLVSLGVLRGKTSSLLKKGAHKPFFPHGIGHSLGIDVHDVGNLRGNNAAILKTGMVFTIEPGLYFPKPIRRVPACGVRIEDDVLVTESGGEILSRGFPKDPDSIAALFN